MTVACLQALCPWDSPGKNTGVEVFCPPPRDLPNPGIEPESLKSPALSGGFFTTSAPWEACIHVYCSFFRLFSDTGYYRKSSRVPCATCWLSILYIIMRIC